MSVLVKKSWLSLKLSQDLSQEQLEKIVHTCIGRLTLRIIKSKPHESELQLLASETSELDVAEAIIYQALIDEKLREKIFSLCESDVNSLVDNVLMRSLGK
jgi:hypothetical protein